MKKSVLLGCTVALAGAILTITGCGASTQEKTVSKASEGSNAPAPSSGKEMRIGFSVNEHTTMYKGAVKFKELVENYSKGAIKVNLFPSSQLGGDLQMIQQLQTGALESTITSSSPVGNIVPELNLYDLPFIFKDEKVADTVLDGPFGQSMLSKLPEKNIVGLAYWEGGFRDLTNGKHSIQNMQDLNGIKLRVMQSPVQLEFWRALGVNPTPMSFDQLFNALQQKVIDAQENPVQTIHDEKYYEVQKYLTLTHHSYAPRIFQVSKIWYDSLSKDEQSWIKKASVEAGKYQREINRQEAQTDIDALKKEGMQVETVSDDFHEQMKQKVKPVIDKYSAQFKDEANQFFDAIKEAEAKESK